MFVNDSFDSNGDSGDFRLDSNVGCSDWMFDDDGADSSDDFDD